MVSLGTSILLTVFIEGVFGSTTTTVTQASTQADTILQLAQSTTTASETSTATSGITTPQTSTTSQRSTTTQGITTPQTSTTSQSTTTTLGITTPQTSTTSQRTTTTQGIATPQTTTTLQSTTTTQGITTSQTTTTTPGIATPQTTTTSQTTTTLQSTTTTPGITTPQTTTTTPGIATPQTSTTSQTTATTQGIATPQSTTTSQSTTTTQGTSSTRNSVPTPSKEPVTYEIDPDDYDLRLQLDLRVYLDFKDQYEDRSSYEFQSLAINLSVSLTQSFRFIKGFKSIEILRFRPGSVIVDYTVNVYPTVDILAVTNQIENEVVDSLREVAGATVDTDYTRSSVKRQLQSLRTRDRCSLASANLCPFGYYCKSVGTATLLCIDRCNVSVCENNGLCYIGHLSQTVQCKCPISDGAVFTGERCEIKQAVMTIQERNMYIIIACSIFGAVIISLVLTVCIINRKRRILKKKLSINLRMKQCKPHTAGVKYVRDDHNRYTDGNEIAINKQQQNILDKTDNSIQVGIAQNMDDGYIHSVGDVREDDGYLRAGAGIRRIEDSVYDYIK